MGNHRFWKDSLLHVYEKCIIPASSSSTSNYSRRVVQKHSFSHTINCPVDSQALITGNDLWNNHLYPSHTPNSSATQNKRARVNTNPFAAIQQQNAPGNNVPETKRKSGLFVRRCELKGKFRSYKVKMYPTPDQKKVLRSWYAASNRAYNAAVDLVRGMSTRANFINLRKQIVVKEAVPEDQKWVLNTPTKVRARAVKQLVDAQHTNIKERGYGRFKLKFRSFRKDNTGTIILEKAFTGDRGPLHHFSSYTGSRKSTGSQKKYCFMNMSPTSFQGVDNAIAIRDRHWLMDKLLEDGILKEDAKIIWDKRTDSWHLIVLIDKELKCMDDNQGEKRIVSLDPGVRSFNTFYSPDGLHGELLVGGLKVLNSMCKDLDKIRSDMDKKKNWYESGVGWVECSYHDYRRSKQHMRRRYHLVSSKLRNWRTNAHYCAINFLLERFDAVLIPEFETKKMAKRAERVISSETVRRMFTWSHYQFRRRLDAKAELDPNKIVKVIGEPGTSKTCGRCGNWNGRLGGKKVFNCSACGLSIDRDVNGARNNLLALVH